MGISRLPLGNLGQNAIWMWPLWSGAKNKVVHSVAPILPSCNYYGNPAHKVSECNIPSGDLFCDYCGKEGHQEGVCFAKFLERKQL